MDIWEDNLRDDILAWVDPVEIGNGKYIYDVWINSKTQDDVNRRPGLRKLPGKDKYIFQKPYGGDFGTSYNPEGYVGCNVVTGFNISYAF